MTADPLWPDWLRDIYGPAPAGPRRREKALAADAERKRQIEARLRERLPPAPRPPAPAKKPDTTAEDMRQARIALGLETDPPAEAAE
jgi:hypothetical protein